MILPLAIETLTDKSITTEVVSRKPNSIELNVTIRFASKRVRA